jgi:hypothetical protein
LRNYVSGVCLLIDIGNWCKCGNLWYPGNESKTGTNPTIMIYNGSALKKYNGPNYPVCSSYNFYNSMKRHSSLGTYYVLQRVCCSCKCSDRRIGSWMLRAICLTFCHSSSWKRLDGRISVSVCDGHDFRLACGLRNATRAVTRYPFAGAHLLKLTYLLACRKAQKTMLFSTQWPKLMWSKFRGRLFNSPLRSSPQGANSCWKINSWWGVLYV